MSLFEAAEKQNRDRAMPLAARMRPRSLAEFVGQQHFLGEGKLLKRLLAADRLGSVIFYGPPGTGKTTLARLLATESKSQFVQLNAVTSGVKELREVIGQARDRLAADGRRTLLFIDEIHRFNKTQQDVLLPDVEDGAIILVGATTQNPFFALTSALVSRSQVFEFLALTPEEVKTLLWRAVEDKERGLGNFRVRLHDDAAEYLAEVCDGDARRALAALEVGVLSDRTALPGRQKDGSEEPSYEDPHPGPLPNGEGTIEYTRELAAESVQRKAIEYDRDGDAHYDAASALIKSLRGSDPDAAIYWLARMLEAGEEVRFLTRRLVILASEDIGNADPHALPLAVAAMQACEFVGLPECQLSLAQAVTYLACAPKSNAATLAIGEARKDVREGRLLPVPVHLRDRHYAGANRLGHGADYEYSHNAAGGVAAQDYLGVEREYYRPVNRGFEQELTARLQNIRAVLREGRERREERTEKREGGERDAD